MVSDVFESLGSENPALLLKKWLTEARGHSAGGGEPWAAALSTVDSQADSQARPSCRMVLVKEIRQKSSQPPELVFFTNYESGKGRDLSQNPHAALLFYWPALGRQIRAQGRARKISRQRSAAYWRSRSRGSQLSQTVSRQSASAAGRPALEDLWRRAEAQFRGREIPCPPHWGGYSLSAQKIEFWTDRPRRLHDRFLFEKKPRGGWSCRRLFP